MGCFAYLVQLLFNASLLPTDAIFWIFAGIAMWYAVKQTKKEEKEIHLRWCIDKGATKAAAASVLVVVVAFIVFIFGKPVLADYYLRNGLEAQAAKDIPASLDYFKRAASVDSGEYYLVQLGNLYSELASRTSNKGYFLQAIETLKRAQSVNPLDESSYFHLGNVYLAASDKFDQSVYLKQAEQNYQAVLSMDPNYAECHLRLGIVYAGTGQERKAIEEWKQVTVLAPGSVAAYYNISNLYKEKGQKDKAIDYLRQGLKVNSSDQRLKDALRELESTV
jgi:tetratricopeptide (TPR) repeat protein